MRSEKKISTSDSTHLNPLFQYSLANALGTGMVNPFTSAYAVQLGASSSEMGWLNSLTSIANNVLQVFWGRLSDRMGRRIPFLILGTLAVTSLWIPMMFVADASQLIILLVVQALLGSMTTSTWIALIGDLVPSFRLGRALASIHRWASLGTFIATLASGFIMISIGGNVREMFFVPLIVAVFCGGLSSLLLLSVKEQKNLSQNLANIGSDLLIIVKRVKNSRDFIKYSSIRCLYILFMAFSWPLLSITLVRVLKASMLEIALLSVSQLGTTIIFQKFAGKLADQWGRKPLLLAFRFGFVTVPLAYAFVPNVNFLIVLSAFWGILFALAHASMTAYLLDTIPREHSGSLTAFHNLLIGVSSFLGSLLGGYLSSYTITLFGLVSGLQIVYVLSAVGRFVGATTYLTLRETLDKTIKEDSMPTKSVT